MADPIMYSSEDYYVLLEPNQPEQILTAAELFDRLKAVLNDRQDNLPRDVQQFTHLDEQTKYLMETACALDMNPGEYLQWYAVRLEK
ncbi:chlororespiratory reduction protein 7 [Leptolyngbya sp. FACHB-711]|uniref:chlororespiratory reduction protein 7 n=1 Tax=unclassified Leptolyngbya TaxID=2650499 RepID=UPI001682F05B|nr:chlororespiratory reduction protein 7 [Leptolyngbya sp. FACHB-711]MBD1849849.1 chlororespiratory reduction protein 7 [Cyanobacteria bacterium FACHB-502]MBD2023151.1 chlororespiratory reduction protein 7 [Leptolyngbya sp. FACHB-711]